MANQRLTLEVVHSMGAGHLDEIDLVKKRQQTEYFKSRLRERKWKLKGFLVRQKKIMD